MPEGVSPPQSGTEEEQKGDLGQSPAHLEPRPPFRRRKLPTKLKGDWTPENDEGCTLTTRQFREHPDTVPSEETGVVVISTMENSGTMIAFATSMQWEAGSIGIWDGNSTFREYQQPIIQSNGNECREAQISRNSIKFLIISSKIERIP